jgi:hypothetical protein
MGRWSVGKSKLDFSEGTMALATSLIMCPAMLQSITKAAHERRITLLGALLAVTLAMSAAGAAGTSAGPVSPQVQEQGLGELTQESPAMRWRPGDPVRVVPDLRQSGEPGSEPVIEMLPPEPLKPIVRAPVAPRTLEGDVEDLPTVEPYQEGGPVWIVPDLRESDAEE